MSPSEAQRFVGTTLVLGVGGSIAAYKAAGLLRLLVKEGATVSVVMTAAATRFVSPLTFDVLSGQPTHTDLFAARDEMQHLLLAERADAIVIAPATANTLAKLASGLADDLLSTIVLASRAPLIVAPAMDGGMWDHPAVQANVATLRARGAVIVEPGFGPLASGKVGKGRLADEVEVLQAVEQALAPVRDLAGECVLVSAGPTQEPIDPVRFLSNRSSGKMGYAVAQAARDRGARVILVSGPTALAPPLGVETVVVGTAEEMSKALLSRLSRASMVVMAAAVADFRPTSVRPRKIKKTGEDARHLALEPTEDILLALCAQRTTQVIAGFAAETDDIITHATEKLRRKGLDVIVANDVTRPGAGFGADTNMAVLIDRHQQVRELPLMSKRELADRILDVMKTLKPRGPQGRSRTR